MERYGSRPRADTQLSGGAGGAHGPVLPPGSVYSEPGGPQGDHFARTGDEPVVVHIVGEGPTDTHYVDPADEPHAVSVRAR